MKGTNAILYFMLNLSSSLLNLNIFGEKAGHASCMVTTPIVMNDHAETYPLFVMVYRVLSMNPLDRIVPYDW